MSSDLPPFGPRPGIRTRRTMPFGQMPMRSLIPNSITVFALCAGLTSIRFALEGRFEAAVAAIIVASIFDALDGRVARLLQGTSRFGAELDSLTDFVNFGVAPVVVLYLWSLVDIGGVGWIAVLGFTICAALRLARFNVALEDPDKPVWAMNYFVGVPAPAGAMLVLLPLYLSFLDMPSIRDFSPLIAVHCGFVAFLMVSRIPTFSGKRLGLRITREMALPILLFVGLAAALILSYPWTTLVMLSIGYLATIPFSVMRHRYHMSRTAKASTQPHDSDLTVD